MNPLTRRTLAPLALCAVGSGVGYADARLALPVASHVADGATLGDLNELRRDMSLELAGLRRDFYAATGLGALGGMGVAGGFAALEERRKRAATEASR